MEVSHEPGGPLTLTFEEDSTLEEFVERARRDSGFVAPLPRGLDLYAKLAVRLVSGGEASCEIEAEVAQVFPGEGGTFQTAFLLDPAKLVVRPAQRARAEQAGEVDGTSPIFAIKKMNPNQKARLAARASRSERQILLRESSVQVMQGLLVNPRIEVKEILQIVKSTHANALILQRVASDARWGKNAEILATVAKNPKTPVPFATKLIDRLRTSDLRLMAKMQSGMREVVRKAALREYMRRTGSGR